MQPRIQQIKNGIVYDSQTADLIYYEKLRSDMFDFLAVTPDSHYFFIRSGFPHLAGLIMGTQEILPCSRLAAIEWAIRNNIPPKAFEQLGVAILPKPDVPAHKPYQPLRDCEILHFKVKRFIAPLIYTTYELLLQNPEGRFFLRKYARRMNHFAYEELRPMPQLTALRWAILNDAPADALQTLGVIPNFQHKPQHKGIQDLYASHT